MEEVLWAFHPRAIPDGRQIGLDHRFQSEKQTGFAFAGWYQAGNTGHYQRIGELFGSEWWILTPTNHRMRGI
jgi:hypothetical protein